MHGRGRSRTQKCGLQPTFWDHGDWSQKGHWCTNALTNRDQHVRKPSQQVAASKEILSWVRDICIEAGHRGSEVINGAAGWVQQIIIIYMHMSLSYFSTPCCPCRCLFRPRAGWAISCRPPAAASALSRLPRLLLLLVAIPRPARASAAAAASAAVLGP